MGRTCVIVPAFNEASVIGGVLAELSALPCAVVVVDDGSADDSGAVCGRYPVHVVRHLCNLGQGAALQTGLEYALSTLDSAYLVTFDADGQHDVGDVESLIRPLISGDADVALGTRLVRSADADRVPARRRLLLRAAVVFTRLTTGMRVTDTHNGLRAFTAAAAGRIRLQQNRMAHASELLSTIHRERLRWCEVPVSVTYTEHSSKKGQRSAGAVDIVWDLIVGRFA